METSQPPLIESTPTRSITITVLCVIMLIGGLLSIPLIFSAGARNIGAWYPPYLAFSSLVGLVCMVGLWKMRRWAVFTYTAFVALNQIVLFAMGIWNILALLIPGIFIGVIFSQISKMR